MHTVKVGNTRVKIYHWQGGNAYHQFKVAYYADGKLRRETFGNLAKAKARANEIAVQIERGERDMLKLTSADRAGYVAALNLLQPLGVPLHAAVEEYVAARAQLAGGESLLSAVKEHAARRHRVVEKRWARSLKNCSQQKSATVQARVI